MNLVILHGEIVSDPTLRQVDNRTKCEFRLRTAAEGRGGGKPDYHNIVCWGAQAVAVHKFQRKGKMVLIRGRATRYRYECKGCGKPHYYGEVSAYTVDFLSSRDSEADPGTAPAPWEDGGPYAGGDDEDDEDCGL